MLGHSSAVCSSDQSSCYRYYEWCYYHVMCLLGYNRTCTLVAITGTTIPVPNLQVKLLQLIWRLGTRRFHLRVPDLQMSCSHLTECIDTHLVAPVMATRATDIPYFTVCRPHWSSVSDIVSICLYPLPIAHPIWLWIEICMHSCTPIGWNTGPRAPRVNELHIRKLVNVNVHDIYSIAIGLSFITKLCCIIHLIATVTFA